jgi:hypothetical protein
MSGVLGLGERVTSQADLPASRCGGEAPFRNAERGPPRRMLLVSPVREPYPRHVAGGRRAIRGSSSRAQYLSRVKPTVEKFQLTVRRDL